MNSSHQFQIETARRQIAGARQRIADLQGMTFGGDSTLGDADPSPLIALVAHLRDEMGVPEEWAFPVTDPADIVHDEQGRFLVASNPELLAGWLANIDAAELEVDAFEAFANAAD